MNKIATVAASAIFVCNIVFAAPTVTSATAKQRFPWNGLVDITCSVSEFDGTSGAREFSVATVMPDSSKALNVSHFWVVRDGTNSTDLTVSGNGNYNLVWDASADLGEVRHTNMVVRVTLDRGKVQLWNGGPYWATSNIGAEEPWEYGLYFWWGDTIGYWRENDTWVASNGSSQNFSFNTDNTPTYSMINATLQSEGWITSDGVLTPTHDAAHMHWGGRWRMPTVQELGDLNNNCDCVWTTMNGVNGYVVRGRGDYAASSIFLPAAGYGERTSISRTGSWVKYWSSVPYALYSDGKYLSCELTTYSGSPITSGDSRFRGMPVRAVQGLSE